MLLVFVSCRIASFRDNSINKWQRKTEVATGAAAIKGKLQAFNQVKPYDWTDFYSFMSIRCNTGSLNSSITYRILVSKLLII